MSESPIIIYRIFCRISGKAYIGITRTKLAKRWSGHLSPSSRSLVGAAVRKYGVEAFSVEHLASAKTWDDACVAEKLIIAQERTVVPSGYNIDQGGSSHPRKYNKEEHNRKISAVMKKRGISHELRQKMNAANKYVGSQANREHLRAVALPPERMAEVFRKANAGRKHTADEIAKRSASLRVTYANLSPEKQAAWRSAISRGSKGKKLSAETRRKISEVQTGRPLSDAAKAKLSQTLKGRKLPPEWRAKIAIAATGRVMSEEAKAKMRAAKLAHWAKVKAAGVRYGDAC